GEIIWSIIIVDHFGGHCNHMWHRAFRFLLLYWVFTRHRYEAILAVPTHVEDYLRRSYRNSSSSNSAHCAQLLRSLATSINRTAAPSYSDVTQTSRCDEGSFT
ncbi:unnamed protein product, partial [Discosporangium mesarthrocarpum]